VRRLRRADSLIADLALYRREGVKMDAQDLAGTVAGYLVDRDDIAAVTITPTDDRGVAVAEVTTQGGSRLLLTLVELREGVV
jgi:hypothetical protein